MSGSCRVFGKHIAVDLVFVGGMFKGVVFGCMVGWHMVGQGSQGRYLLPLAFYSFKGQHGYSCREKGTVLAALMV